MNDVTKEIQVLNTLAGNYPARVINFVVMKDGLFTEEDRSVTVRVRPVMTGHIPMVLAAAGSLLPMLSNPRVLLDYRNLLMLHSNECLAVMAVCLNQPVEVLKGMSLADSVQLLEEVVTVNLDFFVQSVLPLLSGGLDRLTAIVRKTTASAEGLSGSKLPLPSLQLDTTSA